MTEITTNQKKKNGKPDMTPMVDLGFLLITFFIYTTTFTKPNTMDFVTPSGDDVPSSPIRVSNTLTVIMGGQNSIYWYQKPLGELTSLDIKKTTYSPDGLRQIIMQKKSICLNPDNWTVIIKPTKNATWQNTIDVLDETFITDSKKAVVDLTTEELKAFEKIVALN